MKNTDENQNLFQLIIAFFAPLSSVSLMMLGTGFYTTFVSLYLDSLQFPKEDIGLAQSAYFLGMFVGAFRMEKMIKKIGHIQTLAVFGSVATSSILAQAFFQTLTGWMLFRFTMGLSLAAIYIVIESWMLNHSTMTTRGVVLSLYMMSLYASQAISQQMLHFVEIKSFVPFLICALFTSLSIIPVSLYTKKISLPPMHEVMKLTKIFQISPFGVSGCFISALILSSIYAFFPLVATSKSLSSEHVMTLSIGGGVLLQWPIGKLSDFFERRKTMIVTVLMTLGLTVGSFVYTGSDLTKIYLLIFLLGGFAFTLYPLSITQVCDRVDHSEITSTTAYLLIIFGLGSVLGPIFASYFVQFFGIHYIYLYFSILLSILIVIGLLSSIQNPVVPSEEQNDFISLPNTTPIAYELDPRGEEEAT